MPEPPDFTKYARSKKAPPPEAELDSPTQGKTPTSTWEENLDPSLERPKPAIRTMKTDIQGLFKDTKPSLMQIIEHGGRAMPQDRLNGHRKRGFRFIHLVLIILFLSSAFGAAAYLFPGIFPRAFPWASTPAEAPKPTFSAEPTPPNAIFATEKTVTLTVTSDRTFFLDQVAALVGVTGEREGTIKRILIKLEGEPQSRYATPADTFNLWRVAPPARFLERLYPMLETVIYYDKEGGRFAMVLHTRDASRTLADFIAWERTMVPDLTPFLFSEAITATTTRFQDTMYRNIDWRFISLSHTEDLGIGYTIFPAQNYAVVTTGRRAMEAVIDRLYDAR